MEMANGIKAAFKRDLNTLNWLDESTRSAAKMKADAVSEKIGFLSSQWLTLS